MKYGFQHSRDNNRLVGIGVSINRHFRIVAFSYRSPYTVPFRPSGYRTMLIRTRNRLPATDLANQSTSMAINRIRVSRSVLAISQIHSTARILQTGLHQGTRCSLPLRQTRPVHHYLTVGSQRPLTGIPIIATSHGGNNNSSKYSCHTVPSLLLTRRPRMTVYKTRRTSIALRMIGHQNHPERRL